MMVCRECERLLSSLGARLVSFSQIRDPSTLPAAPAIKFIVVSRVRTPIDQVVNAVKRLENTWPCLWSNIGGRLSKIFGLKSHLERCSTVFIGRTGNLRRRFQALSWRMGGREGEERGGFHTATPQVYTLALFGWEFTLAYREPKKEQIEVLRKVIGKNPLEFLTTLVGYYYIRHHGSLPPLNSKVGKITQKHVKTCIDKDVVSAMSEFYGYNEDTVRKALKMIREWMLVDFIHL